MVDLVHEIRAKPTFENARLAADEIERLREGFKRLSVQSDYPTMTRSDMVNFAKKMLEEKD